MSRPNATRPGPASSAGSGRWDVLRAWAGVHSTATAGRTLAVIAVGSLVLSQVSFSDFGMVRLISPMSALLLLPVIAGAAAAIACDNTARLPLPDPPGAKLARAVWAAAWTTAAGLATTAGILVGSPAGWGAIVRNLLIYNGLGLIVLALGYPHLTWLPALTYTMACMLFGYPNNGLGYYWWATVMTDQATTADVVCAGGIYLAAFASYVAPIRRRRNEDML
ncbi:hypothetical protein [Planosporangium mesophilum]|uniref:hypothetical protein n=1 Tax=Planosporangium mesophilum TaxID=689768 RepID=UPI001439117B|nr:hypothetical protein [Planosporangium mesophilum]NJC82890.1 hypothetical protein [Planosporangium mesophilum]